MRGGFLRPNEPNTLIYTDQRGRRHRVEQVAINWLGGAPGRNSAVNREKYALRELGLHLEEGIEESDIIPHKKREKRGGGGKRREQEKAKIKAQETHSKNSKARLYYMPTTTLRDSGTPKQDTHNT